MSDAAAGPSGPSAEAQRDGMLKIRVKTMEPANYDLTVNRNITVAALKAEHLESQVNAPPERQRIIFKGRALRNEQTLQDAGIEDNDTLHLVIRPADVPPPSQAPAADAQNAHAGNAGMQFGALPGGVGQILQSLMSGLRVQPGSIQINTMGPMPMPMGAAMPGMAFGQPAATQGSQPAAAAGPGPGAQGQPQEAPDQQQQQQAAWLEAPHLISAINGFLEALQSPSYSPAQTVLAWHPVSPSVNQQLALTRLTDGLREVLRGVYLPAHLRALMEASETDREGRPAPAAGTAAAAAAAAGAAAAGQAQEAGGGGLPHMRQAQQLPELNSYRYLPLAAAALAELTRRADTYISSSLTPHLREISGSLMASAGGPRNQVVEHVTALGQHFASAAALMIELARMATGVASALQGNVAPLVFSRVAALQPNGSGAALPVLQPRGMSPFMVQGRGPAPGNLNDLLMEQMRQAAMAQQQQRQQQQGQQAGQAAPDTGGAAAAAAGAAAQPDAGSQAAQAPAAGPQGLAAELPGGMQGAIRIDIVDDGSGGDLGAALGPLLTNMLGPMMGGLGMPDMAALLQQHQQQVNQQRQQQQAAATPGTQEQQQQQQAAAAPGSQEQSGRAGGQLGEYMAVLRPLIRGMASSVANTVGQRLVPLQPLLQSPAQTGQLVGALVTEVLGETLSRTVETLLAHEDLIQATMQSLEGDQGPAGVQNMVRQVTTLMAQIMGGQQQPGGQGQQQPGAQQQQQQQPAAAPVPAAVAAAEPQQAAATAAPAPAASPAAVAPAAAAAVARSAGAATSTAGVSAASTSEQAPAEHVSAPAPAPAEPAAAAAAASSEVKQAEAAAASSSQAAAPSSAATGRPRGLGLGLQPARKKPTLLSTPKAAAAEPSSSAAAATSSSSPAAAAAAAPGTNMAAAGAPPDMSNMMAMIGRMMSGAGGPTGAGAGAAGGNAPGAAAAGGLGGVLASMASDPSMQRMLSGAGGGSGGGGGAGGLGGLLQMATSVASDPAMQPMLQSAMSSLMGGGSGGAGGGGGLGALLGNLMGGMSQAGGGGAAGGSREGPRVEEILGFEVLEEELGPEEAAAWRGIMEADEEQQQPPAADAAAADEPGFSEVYRAGLPQRPVGLVDRLGGADKKSQ